MRKVNLSPPREPIIDWAMEVYERVGEQGFLIQGFHLADTIKPDATSNDVESSVLNNTFTRLYYVPDANGGAGALVFSNGTSWIDTTTGVAVA